MALFLVPRAAHADNQLTYLNNSELALASLYSDIGSAKSTIDMTYLDWDPCSTVSKVLVKELSAKAKGHPKIHVRLMIDSFHGGREA
jgi:phosphatidylserine/phosphatidylglycerophosphate/cardiolipin synthase-like enzyme